jgi:hypothetical protein
MIYISKEIIVPSSDILNGSMRPLKGGSLNGLLWNVIFP